MGHNLYEDVNKKKIVSRKVPTVMSAAAVQDDRCADEDDGQDSKERYQP